VGVGVQANDARLGRARGAAEVGVHSNPSSVQASDAKLLRARGAAEVGVQSNPARLGRAIGAAEVGVKTNPERGGVNTACKLERARGATEVGVQSLGNSPSGDLGYAPSGEHGEQGEAERSSSKRRVLCEKSSVFLDLGPIKAPDDTEDVAEGERGTLAVFDLERAGWALFGERPAVFGLELFGDRDLLDFFLRELERRDLFPPL